MKEWFRRRYLDLLGSIYIYNEHRGYTALDRALEAVRARDPDNRDFIEQDESSQWAPYDAWLKVNHTREPQWWERAIDMFIHAELLFLKLPVVFLNPRLGRLTDWSDANECAA